MSPPPESSLPRTPVSARVVAGAVVLLALGIVTTQLIGRQAPPASPTPKVAAQQVRPSEPDPLPLSLSFVSGPRAVQVPVGVMRVDGPDIGALAALARPPEGGGLLVALAAPSIQPLRADVPADRQFVAIYLGVDERVVAVQALAAPVTPPAPAVGPYTVALIAPRSMPHVDLIVVGDRALFGADLRAIVDETQPPLVPIPPRATAEPYPPPAQVRPTIRPTQVSAYPSKG